MFQHSDTIPFMDFTFQHQPIQAELEQAIQGVMQKGDFILGPGVAAFEQGFAAACGVSFGIGVGCGTDAITLGLQACGIGVGDEVIIPANTFIATLIGVIHTGATPVLVDCHPETALIDLASAAKAITPKTKVILPVHLYGQMVSPQQLLDFANTYHLLIFEDAAQAHLAEREGYRAGSVGTAAAFSFYPSKNLGAFGDGGMVVTQDAAVAENVRVLRNYGAPRKYEHTSLGTNSRLDSMQAAILTVKLPYLEAWNQQRKIAAQQYDTLLKPLEKNGIIPIQNESSRGHVYHLYVIRVLARPIARNSLQEKLTRHGIQVGIHYPIPCHLQFAYQYLGYKQGDFPQAESLCQQVLSLPMYPGLNDVQVEKIVHTLKHSLC